MRRDAEALVLVLAAVMTGVIVGCKNMLALSVRVCHLYISVCVTVFSQCKVIRSRRRRCRHLLLAWIRGSVFRIRVKHKTAPFSFGEPASAGVPLLTLSV